MARDIAVNGRFLARRVTGVERYGREILRYIGDNSRVISTRPQGWRGHAWEQFLLPTRLSPRSVLWSPANTGPLLVRNQALTIHDLNPLEHPDWFRASFAGWYRLFLPILVRRVSKIFTPSEHVKQKVIKRFGLRNVTVTPTALCSRFTSTMNMASGNLSIARMPSRFLSSRANSRRIADCSCLP